jgi:hypothetical protein
MRTPRIIHAIRSRLSLEGGFTMPAVMAAMTAIMGMSVGAIAVATDDFGGNNYNSKTKQAVAAAEAGIADYLYHLNQDNAYWAKCTNVETPNAVNQRGSITRRRNVPGTVGTDYALELLPANGQAACSEANAAGTMIDSASGTFRIRSTGRVATNNNTGFATRQLTATFKRRSFLDYLYFTDYETSDPAWYERDSGGLPNRTPKGNTGPHKNLVQWASENCDTYWKDGRDDLVFDGEIQYGGDWYDWPKKCNRIQFAPGDEINGPLHTNDDLYVCGSPTFGRNASDKIEVSGQTADTPGWRPACSGANPNFVGTFNPTALKLTLPPSNTKIEQVADPNYKFVGKTTIVLNGTNMQVTNQARGLNGTTMALPSNGVIFVDDGTCGVAYKPSDPYGTGAPEGCGDVWVRGTYSRDLTIAARRDIVINENITKSGDFVLGLIANQFVRVYHPVDSGCDNNGGPFSIQIDAAILALQHSFTVDHYYCGSPLGTLTVNGVIAQKFRGPVGTGGSSVSTGYLKDYNYDDRLQLRQPPYFLDPIQSAWRIQRQTE